MATDNITL